ncbi:MAG: NAD(+) synthase [Peptococcaceae bacterium]|nr:NAD(+) synthase [Peptococcaceae bacterium]
MEIRERADKIIQWLDSMLKKAEARGFVVGLSGGIDSAVTAALCKRVCPEYTLGVIMPCYSDPQDALDAQLVADAFNIPVEKIVLDDIFELFVRKLTGKPYDGTQKDLAIANIKPRLRMTTLYFFASTRRSLVVGTSNKSELTVGYFTKYGDGGADLFPIANLVKSEVREFARYLGVPQRIIDKPPSAGLWIGHNDEAEMGVTYEELDRCILTGECSLKARAIIEEMSRRSEHKKTMPLMPPV